MKNRQGTLCIALVAGAVGFGTALMLGAGDPDKGKAPHGQPQMTPEMQKMMEAWEAASKVGPMHEKLNFFAGNWNCDVEEMWGGNTQKSKGSMTSESIYGGRFIMSKYQGEMMGAPFMGTAVMGYNNASKMYETLWFDSMSTGMALSTGSMDTAGKKLSMSGETVCPMTGKPMTCRSTTTITGPDSYTMEFYHPNMEGKEELAMVINYKRAK